MGLRALQPAMFGLAALSFLLPFAHVSCAGESDTYVDPDAVTEAERTTDLHGYDLVVGGDPEEHFPDLVAESEMQDSDVRFGAEPFAGLALAAAVGGAAVSLVAPWPRRPLAGVVAGAAGILSLILLGLAPALRSLGLIRVEWRAGYWTCLALFVAATAVSYLEHQRIPRPPPRGPG